MVFKTSSAIFSPDFSPEASFQLPLIAVSFAGFGSAHQPVDAIATMHKKVTCLTMMLLERNASQRRAQQDTMPGAAAGSKPKTGKESQIQCSASRSLT